MKLRSALIAALTCSFLLAACTSESPTDEADEAAPLTPTLVDVSSPTSVVDGASPTDIALAASQAFFSQAPVVVVADAADASAQEQAATLAGDVGAPLLLAAAPASEPAPSATASPGGDHACSGVEFRGRRGSESGRRRDRAPRRDDGGDLPAPAPPGSPTLWAMGCRALRPRPEPLLPEVELPAIEPATPSASVLALATPRRAWPRRQPRGPRAPRYAA